MTKKLLHAIKYPLVNSITEIIDKTINKPTLTALMTNGLFSKKTAIKIKAGKSTETYRGSEEKLPERVDTRYPAVKK